MKTNLDSSSARIAALSDEQLNIKLAKMNGWKLVNGKWWHDDFGDEPPPDFCNVLGRKLAERFLPAE